VKPRGEAASFGLKVVHDDSSLKEAISKLFEEYKQPTLAEEFIEGREVNVSVLGNLPPQALPVLEVVLSEECQGIYSHDAKFKRSPKKKVKMVCPAELPRETAAYLQKLAVRVFEVLNIYDFGRVDFRLDEYNRPWILEMNSMASINPGSSFIRAAMKAGYSYDQLINRIIEVAIERYAKEAPDFFSPVNNTNKR
jgi:D-alanine-D-alanine ligase